MFFPLTGLDEKVKKFETKLDAVVEVEKKEFDVEGKFSISKDCCFYRWSNNLFPVSILWTLQFNNGSLISCLKFIWKELYRVSRETRHTHTKSIFSGHFVVETKTITTSSNDCMKQLRNITVITIKLLTLIKKDTFQDK